MNAIIKSLTKYLTEIVTATKVVCDNCGWSWDLADGGDDPYICHNILPSGNMCKHDNNRNLNESGEGNAEPFKWTSVGDLKTFIEQLKAMDPEYGDDTFIYKFSSDNADYIVNTSVKTIPPTRLYNSKYDLYAAFGFDVEGGKEKLTNYNEHYRVMATMLEIIIDFINTADTIENIDVKQIQFHPKADNEDSYFNDRDVNSRRGKFYKSYIEKNLNKLNKKYNLKTTESKFYLEPAYTYPIKENQNKVWNLKEGMLSLAKYMIDKGLNIQPLPAVKFIKDDEENASNMLGKTAYYNPLEKSITLYTFGRHSKDILRSFSHEMIHHMQNLENRLNNITTTNTNEDGDLPELEREAYELGNMTLREWEDSIKNKK
jgi:hypothetical protein